MRRLSSSFRPRYLMGGAAQRRSWKSDSSQRLHMARSSVQRPALRRCAAAARLAPCISLLLPLPSLVFCSYHLLLMIMKLVCVLLPPHQSFFILCTLLRPSGTSPFTSTQDRPADSKSYFENTSSSASSQAAQTLGAGELN